MAEYTITAILLLPYLIPHHFIHLFVELPISSDNGLAFSSVLQSRVCKYIVHDH